MITQGTKDKALFQLEDSADIQMGKKCLAEDL